MLNGADIPGATNSTYTTVPVHGDRMEVRLVNQDRCSFPETFNSNQLSVNIKPRETTAVSISSSTVNNSICENTPVTYTAAIQHAGTSPTIRWWKNNAEVIGGSLTYTDAFPKDGDVISVTVSSSDRCSAPQTVTSNTITTRVLTHLRATVYKTICAKDLPFTWNSMTFNSTGNHTTSFRTVSTITGCDSTTELYLTVSAVPVSVERDTVSCGPLAMRGITYDQSTVVRDTLFNSAGCDSMYISTNITIHRNEPEIKNIDLAGCKTVTYDEEVYTSSTSFREIHKNTLGCDSLIRHVNITVDPFEISLTADSLEAIFAGDQIRLQVNSNQDDYQILRWTPENLFSNTEARAHLIPGIANGEYEVFGISAGGCPDSSRVSVFLKPMPKEPFYPSAFSPNNSRLNDTWKPVRADLDGHLEVWVYNRWGQCVFHASQKGQEWDGTYQGAKVPPGVYPYVVRVHNRFVIRSSVTVIY